MGFVANDNGATYMLLLRIGGSSGWRPICRWNAEASRARKHTLMALDPAGAPDVSERCRHFARQQRRWDTPN